MKNNAILALVIAFNKLDFRYRKSFFMFSFTQMMTMSFSSMVKFVFDDNITYGLFSLCQNAMETIFVVVVVIVLIVVCSNKNLKYLPQRIVHACGQNIWRQNDCVAVFLWRCKCHETFHQVKHVTISVTVYQTETFNFITIIYRSQ